MNPLLDHFYRATLICTGDKRVKLRLAEAWIQELDKLHSADLPAVIRDDFRALRKAMHKNAALNSEHAANASVRKMSISEAEKLTGRIVSMFQRLAVAASQKPASELTLTKGSEAILEAEGIHQLN